MIPVIPNPTTAQSLTDGTATITVNGGVAAPFPDYDDDDDPLDDDYGFQLRNVDDIEPDQGFLIGVDGGTLNAFGANAAKAAVTFGAGAPTSHIGVWSGGSITGTITGHAGMNLLEVGAEVEDDDTADVTADVTGNIDLGDGTNGVVFQSIVEGSHNATSTITGNLTGGTGMDYFELAAEGIDPANTGGLAALTTLTGALDLGAGNNLLDVTATVGNADATVTVTGTTSFGGGDDHLYLFSEFEEGSAFQAANRGSALINFQNTIDLGGGTNTVILEGEGANEAKARIVLNSAADGSGTARSILGGSGNDRFYLFEANLSGNIDLNTASGGTDVVNMVSSRLGSSLTFGGTGGTLNLAGINTLDVLATNGNLAIRRLATDATYINSGATYADGVGGATLTLSGNLTDAGGNTLTLGSGVTLRPGGATDIGDTLHLSIGSGAILDFDTSGPGTETIASLSGQGSVRLGDTDLTLGGNAPAAFGGSLTGTGDLAVQGSHTFSGNNTFGALAVNAGGSTVAFNGNNQIGGNIAVTAGTLRLAGTNTFGGTATVTRGLFPRAGGLGTPTGVTLHTGATLGSIGDVGLSGVSLAAGADVTANTGGGDLRIAGLTLDGNHTLTQTGDGILTFRNLSETNAGDVLDLADGSKLRLTATTANTTVAGDMNDDTVANTAAGGATVIVEHPDYIPDVDTATISLIKAGAALGTHDATTNTTTVTTDQDLSGGGAVATTEGGSLDMTGVQTTLDGTATFDGGGTVNVGPVTLNNDATVTLPSGTALTFAQGVEAADKELALDGTGTAGIGSNSRVKKVTVGGTSTLRLGADLVTTDGVAMGDGTALETSGTRSVTGNLNLADNGGGGATSATVRGSGTARVTALGVQDGDGATLNLGTGSTLAAGRIDNGAAPLAVQGGGVIELGDPGAISDSTGYTGKLTVGGGTAKVNTNLGGDVEVGTSGVLMGEGGIGGNATVGGTHRPGNSIATTTVAGDYTLNAGATVEIEVDNDGNSDKLAVGNNATLAANAKVKFLGEDGLRLKKDLTGVEWLTYGNTLTVAGTARAADGSNDTIIDAALADLRDTAILDFTLYVSSGAKAILADVERQATYASFATTANAGAVGWALDNYTGTNTDVLAMLNTIDNLGTDAEVAAALVSLSPEATAGMPSVARNVTGAMGHRLGLRMQGLRQAAWSETAVLPAAVAPETGRDGLTVWATPFGTWGDQDRVDDVQGYEWDSAGLSLGLETLLTPSLLAGASLGYAGTDYDADRFCSAEIDTWRLDLYGTWMRERFYLEGGAYYAWHDIDGHRDITFLASTASYDTDADAYGLHLGGGYRFTAGPVDLIPNLTFAWSDFDQDSYTESGAPGANLAVGSVEEDSFTHLLGLDLEHALSDRLVLTASAAWRHEYNNDETTIRAAFAGSPTFTTRGLDPADDSGLFGVGLEGSVKTNVGASVKYTYEVRDDYDAHNLTARIGISF